MEETMRMSLTVPPDVPDLLAELAGGKRNMGAYLTDLIRRLHSAHHAAPVPPGEPMDLQAAALVELERRVSELEQRMERGK